MSYVSPFNCDNAWLSFEDILRKVYVDGYIRTYGDIVGDSIAPTILSAEVGTFADDVIVLTYDEPLDPASVPSFLDYAPAWAICPASITSVSIVGSTVHLQLSQDMYAYETIQMSYTAGVNPVQDLAGNLAVDFISYPVTNNVTPEAQYVTVWNAFPTKPSTYNSTLFNAWMKGMVAGGYYAKAEFLDFFSTEHQDGSLFDWHGLTFNPSLVNAPTWTQYQGYTGIDIGSHCLRSNFNPAINGTIIGQNNICAIIGIGNNLGLDRYDLGAISAGILAIRSRNAAGNALFFWNEWTGTTIANANSKKYYAASRGLAANYDTYMNLVKQNNVIASVALPNAEIYILSHSGGAGTASVHQIRFAFLFSYLTEAEVNGVINLTEALLDALGTGLI